MTGAAKRRGIPTDCGAVGISQATRRVGLRSHQCSGVRWTELAWVEEIQYRGQGRRRSFKGRVAPNVAARPCRAFQVGAPSRDERATCLLAHPGKERTQGSES